MRKLSALSTWVKKKINPKVAEVYSEQFSLGSENEISIKIEKFALKTNTRFLEDVQIGSERQIISSVADGVLVSSDNGKTWLEHRLEKDFKKCFTTLSGIHLLQNTNGTTFRYDSKWNFMDKVEVGDFPWHGSWSVSQNPKTGVIIWCEYPYSSERVCVWRSTNEGKTWDMCFEQNGHVSNPKAGDIRHFHLVQCCSTFDGRWYLASGDTEDQSKLWCSEDDGITWEKQEIGVIHDKPDSIKANLAGRFHRFTSMLQTETEIIFPTDDTFKGSGARICSIPKDNLSEIYVFDGSCGFNEMRNFIKIDNSYAIAISESKLDRSGVDVSIVDLLNKRVAKAFQIKNKEGVKTNFANSISSKVAINNQFYTLGDNCIFKPAPMTLRWSILQTRR